MDDFYIGKWNKEEELFMCKMIIWLWQDAVPSDEDKKRINQILNIHDLDLSEDSFFDLCEDEDE